MRATASTSSRTSASNKASKASKADAIKLLRADHAEAKKLFEAYDKLALRKASAKERGRIAGTICMMLTVHATIEEEIFYPAAREVLDQQDLVDEAAVEHASAKDLIAQIEGMQPDDELYDAKVKVLGEYIDHHVKEEQTELFPKARKAGLDVKAVGELLQQRKAELMAEQEAVH